MEEKYIIFDTNYINIILNNRDRYRKLLENISKEYRISINIVTFVELVRQHINNTIKFNEMMDFFIINQIYISEFKINKCILDEKFSFYKFKEFKSKTDRKKYFRNINYRYIEFISKFISLNWEWCVYLLFIVLVDNNLYYIRYMEYLNKKSFIVKDKFINLLQEKRKNKRIKDAFIEEIYKELKILKNNNIISNKETVEMLINSFIENPNTAQSLFYASKKEKNIRNEIVEIFLKHEIKPFMDEKFNNKIFEKYIREIFEKIVIREGKMDPNDIADALIVSTMKEKDIIITNDKKVVKFLKKENLYNEDIYMKFKEAEIF